MTITMMAARAVSPGIEAQLREAVAVAALHDSSLPLADELYAKWYARPVVARPTTDETVGSVGTHAASTGGPPLAGALRAAHPGAARWSPATVRSADPRGGLVVQLEGTGPHRVVLPGDVTHADPVGRGGLLPQPGDEVLVSHRHGALTLSGWWRTWSADWSLASPPRLLTRIYLCTSRQHQVRAVGAVLRLLGETGATWLLKTAVHPALQDRPDRTVVYVPDASAPDLLSALGPTVGHLLDPHRPPLTAGAGTGIGWAQDDGEGPSFGESRCALLARALAGPADDPDHLVDRAVAVLARAGLDPSRPHLRARGAAS